MSSLVFLSFSGLFGFVVGLERACNPPGKMLRCPSRIGLAAPSFEKHSRAWQGKKSLGMGFGNQNPRYSFRFLLRV
jgi:hypothetical protein